MSLIKCPECGKEISDSAPMCPNCGFPIQNVANASKQSHNNMGKTYGSDSIKGINDIPFKQTGAQFSDANGVQDISKNRIQIAMVLILLGLFSAMISKVLSFVLVACGVWCIVKTKKNGFKIPIGNCVLICVLMFFSVLVWIIPEENDTKESTSNVSLENAVESSEPKDNIVEDVEEASPKDSIKDKKIKKTQNKKLTKNEYKKKCKMKYHDAIFFSKKDLSGKYVKLKLMIGEERCFDTYIDSETQEFIKKNKIQRDFYECYVKRKGSSSYVSNGTVTVYLPKKFNASKYHSGDYITVYGKISSFSKNTWSGYNSVSVVAKYIEKGKR